MHLYIRFSLKKKQVPTLQTTEENKEIVFDAPSGHSRMQAGHHITDYLIWRPRLSLKVSNADFWKVLQRGIFEFWQVAF